MKKILLILPTALLLTACGTPSVEDFLQDANLRIATGAECLLSAIQGEGDSQKCKNHSIATKKVMECKLSRSLRDSAQCQNINFLF